MLKYLLHFPQLGRAFRATNNDPEFNRIHAENLKLIGSTLLAAEYVRSHARKVSDIMTRTVITVALAQMSAPGGPDIRALEGRSESDPKGGIPRAQICLFAVIAGVAQDERPADRLLPHRRLLIHVGRGVLSYARPSVTHHGPA